MNKKLMVLCLAIVTGLFVTSVARADLGDLSYGITQNILFNSGHTAGTILNPDGKGDLLIFPYYDVREVNGTKTQDFYFAIINEENEGCDETSPTSECNSGMLAKLRFREWDKSEEVFDADIWLSKGDVWVGVLTHNQALALPYGARITSPDFVVLAGTPSSPTVTVGTPLAGGFDFPTTAFIPTGSSNLMGYIEVIAEERTRDNQVGGIVTRYFHDATNTLMGYAYIVRVADGSSHAYNAKAFANFSRAATTLFRGPGNPLPSFVPDAEDTLDQIEFQMAREEVFAGYSIEDVFLGKFSLILTFPTKHFHYCDHLHSYTLKGDVTSSCGTSFPMGPPWTAKQANLPETIDVTIFDRNENRLTPQTVFYSPQPTTPTVGLPFEVNVIGLYKGTPPAVPAAGVRDNLAFSTGTFDSGYIIVEFTNTGLVQATNPKLTVNFLNFGTFFTDYEGLPVFGLALQEFSNNAVGGFYGAILDVFSDSSWSGAHGHGESVNP